MITIFNTVCRILWNTTTWKNKNYETKLTCFMGKILWFSAFTKGQILILQELIMLGTNYKQY